MAFYRCVKMSSSHPIAKILYNTCRLGAAQAAQSSGYGETKKIKFLLEKGKMHFSDGEKIMFRRIGCFCNL
jgi:hypothetical protein